MTKQLITGRDVKGNTAYDDILRAFLDHKTETLPEKLAEMLVRWTDVHRLIRQGEIVKVNGKDQTKRFNFTTLVEWLREKHGVSARTAYEDIRNAKRFFSSCEGRDDVDYARGGSIEVGEMMKWAAFEAGNFEAALGFYKELNKIKGLHETHVELPDYSEFTPPSFIITSDPTELGYEKIGNKEEVVARILNEKRAGFIESEAQDAEEIK